MSHPTILLSQFPSPCGSLEIGMLGNELCLCDWQDNPARNARIKRRLATGLNATFSTGYNDMSLQAISQLEEYFAGQRRQFTIPLHPVGTEFQHRVWKILLRIPYGTTLSYAEMARLLETPTAVRAIANANGANAISIFIPCHRVIGSDGSLTGYGGGLEAKKFLLDLESPRN